jgi:hypothetical protein
MSPILISMISTTTWSIRSYKKQQPPKTNDDTISYMPLPTSQRWSYFLHDAPAQCDEEMFTPYPDLIAYATDLEAELECTIRNSHMIMEKLICHIGTQQKPNHMKSSCDIICFAFYFCFVKASR